MALYETVLWKRGLQYICGVDEVGRGPLAGPVTAAAVILPPGTRRNGIKDSKVLSAAQREKLAEKIKRMAVDWAIESVDPATIDKINILQASLLAMKKAVEKLASRMDIVLVDGIYPIPGVDLDQAALRGGDSISVSIGAASILAKVERDSLMVEYDTLFPEYRFGKNKGYPTREHRLAIHSYGPCSIHRMSFKLLPDGIIQERLRL
jgi:ribonuclease HII